MCKVRAAQEGMSTYYATTSQEHVKMTQNIYFGTVIISLIKAIGFSLIKSSINNLIVNMNYTSRFDYPVNKHSINLKPKIIMLYFILPYHLLFTFLKRCDCTLQNFDFVN